MTEQYLIAQSAALFTALERLNNLSGSGVMTLLATDSAGRVTGTLTDGDIRRSLLRGESLQSPVSEVMHRNFKRLSAGEADVEAVRRFRQEGIELIPIVDSEGLSDCLTRGRRGHCYR